MTEREIAGADPRDELQGDLSYREESLLRAMRWADVRRLLPRPSPAVPGTTEKEKAWQ